MLTEKTFRRHKLDTQRIIATPELDKSVTLTIMEGDVVTTAMKLPEGRDLSSFAEGMLEGMAYQMGDVRLVRLKDAKRR